MKLHRFVPVGMLLPMLTWIAPPSQACTPTSGLSLLAPSSGPVPLSTRVRVGLEGYPSELEQVELVSSNAVRVPLTLELQHVDDSPQKGYRFVYAPPAGLPPGDYHVELTSGTGLYYEAPTLRFEGSGQGLELEGEPVLNEIKAYADHYFGYECSGYTSFATADWTLPLPPGGGWIAEAIDVTTGKPIAWQELTSSHSFRAWIDGPEDSQACFGLKLYNYEHKEVWSETYPCVKLSAGEESSPTPDAPTPAPETPTPPPTHGPLSPTPIPDDSGPFGCSCRAAPASWSGASVLFVIGACSLLARTRPRRRRAARKSPYFPCTHSRGCGGASQAGAGLAMPGSAHQPKTPGSTRGERCLIHGMSREELKCFRLQPLPRSIRC